MPFKSGKDWNGVPHPNYNLKDAPKPGAITEVGKFCRELGKFKRDKVPDELIELYDWFKALDTKKINYLLELKNLYFVTQRAILPTLLDKLIHGENLNKTEIDAIRLLKDFNTEAHKLKFGDHKVIENIVTQADIVKHMQGKKVIDVESKPSTQEDAD